MLLHLKSRSPNLTSSNCYCTCAADKLLLRSTKKLNYLTIAHHNTHFGFSLLFHLENPLWNTDNSTGCILLLWNYISVQRKQIHKETVSNIFCGQPMCGLKPSCKIKTEQGVQHHQLGHNLFDQQGEIERRRIWLKFCVNITSTRVKMTGGTLEVRSEKSLTLLTFDF